MADDLTVELETQITIALPCGECRVRMARICVDGDGLVRPLPRLYLDHSNTTSRWRWNSYVVLR